MPLDLQATSAGVGIDRCRCFGPIDKTRFVVVTGGPGAGKTAILELAKRRFCEHVRVLPEAATMLFGTGFPRSDKVEVKKAAQSAIYHVEVALERATAALGGVSVGLCDRGTLDGVAYWPGTSGSFFVEQETTLERELLRYGAVIHLRTPSGAYYNHQNIVRTEDADRAHAIDQHILEIWSAHPRVHVVEPTEDFLDKARRALDIIHDELTMSWQEA